MKRLSQRRAWPLRWVFVQEIDLRALDSPLAFFSPVFAWGRVVSRSFARTRRVGREIGNVRPAENCWLPAGKVVVRERCRRATGAGQSGVGIRHLLAARD